MKIIVGLGNPGKNYLKTRHNAGFIFLDKLAKGKEFSSNKKFNAEILEVEGGILVKPQTFMNNSGMTVRKILDFYKLSSKDLVVVHDDLDLELGEVKIQEAVGPKVHNGVNSVEQHVGGKDFLRVRLGIDNRKKLPTSLSGADYVLENFGNEEMKIFTKMVEEGVEKLLVTLGLE